MAMIVTGMIMTMVRVVVVVPTAVILLFGMHLCMRRAFVFQPELWYCISDHTS